MKREFKVGDRVAVKENGKTVAKGKITHLPDVRYGRYKVLESSEKVKGMGTLTTNYNAIEEQLRHLRPKPKRDARILEEALEHIGEARRGCCPDHQLLCEKVLHKYWSEK